MFTGSNAVLTLLIVQVSAGFWPFSVYATPVPEYPPPEATTKRVAIIGMSASLQPFSVYRW